MASLNINFGYLVSFLTIQKQQHKNKHFVEREPKVSTEMKRDQFKWLICVAAVTSGDRM